MKTYAQIISTCMLTLSQDTQWNDIDYMNTDLDFTTSTSFGDIQGLVSNLHSHNQKYVLIVVSGYFSHPHLIVCGTKWNVDINVKCSTNLCVCYSKYETHVYFNWNVTNASIYLYIYTILNSY